MPAAEFIASRRRRARRTVAAGGLLVAGCLLYLIQDDLGGRIARVMQSPVASLPVIPSQLQPQPPATVLAVDHELRTERLSVFLADVAEQAGRDLVIAPQVDNEVSALLSASESWRNRLEAFSRTYGFDYSVSDDLIEVYERPQAVQAAAPREPNAESKKHESSPTVSVVALAEAKADELVTAVASAARPMGVTVVAEPVSNSLVCTGTAEGVETCRRLVAELDMARKVFMLEARIVEVSNNARQELGVEWQLLGDVGAAVRFPSDNPAADAASLTAAIDGNPAFSARLSVLEAAGMARVVSRPRLLIREGRAATIESVRILRVRLPDRTATALVTDEEGLNAGSSGPARAVEAIPVGLSVRVEPVWQGNGRILLKIRAKSSALGPPLPPDGIPEEFSRLVEAEVVVADGRTAVLGGLLRHGTGSSGSGVPGLRRLPLVGRVFGSNRDESESEELIFMVTPKLVG